ncbi:MAG: hypothetical protein KGZ58_10845 [Ignavibacteriales bacterium]|nr:hypothetical protein [Ignavibacteriales bacterium]
MKTNQLLVLIFLSLGMFPTLHAQSDSAKNSLVEGANALQFQFEGLSLNGFDGGLLSWKHQYSTLEALRVGISLNAQHSNIKFERGRIGQTPVSRANISIRALKQYYLVPKNSINFYYSYGLLVSLDHYKNNEYSSSYYYSDTWAIGPVGNVGVEWFFHNSMSLSGEYIGVGKLTYKIYDEDIYRRTKTFSYGISYESVKLGLSVYY